MRNNSYQFSDKMDNFEFLGPNLHKKWILGSKFQKSKSGQNGQFWIFGPNMPTNGFWGWNFKNLSLDLESAPPRYHVSQFSVKMDSFEFFGLNLGKLPNYPITWDNLVWILWRMLQRAKWRLEWAGWRWVELIGGGCTV